MEVLISLIFSLLFVLFLFITATKIIIFILQKLIWLVTLPFRDKNALRSHEEMRGVFTNLRKYKFHSKIIKSQSHGLSGLWHQLLIRTNFDIAKAERLIQTLRIKHPTKSDRWLIEKAIWDFERDRGRY